MRHYGATTIKGRNSFDIAAGWRTAVAMTCWSQATVVAG
jgi:hypothetical protein